MASKAEKYHEACVALDKMELRAPVAGISVDREGMLLFTMPYGTNVGSEQALELAAWINDVFGDKGDE